MTRKCPLKDEHLQQNFRSLLHASTKAFALFCASGSMFPLYQLSGLQLRADEMHENANSGCLTASQSTCYDLLFFLTDNCTISCNVWSSSPAPAAPLLDLLYYFCFNVSLLPHICRTDRYVSSVFQKWRKYGQNQSGYLWPELTAINVVNHPLSCDKSPSFCDCGLLCGNSHCTDQ